MDDIETITMSTKGQIIIPARLRKKYGLKKGKKVVLIDDDGYIKVQPPTDLRKLCGSWHELDAEALTKEIIQDREDDEERERLIEAAIKKSSKK